MIKKNRKYLIIFSAILLINQTETISWNLKSDWLSTISLPHFWQEYKRPLCVIIAAFVVGAALFGYSKSKGKAPIINDNKENIIASETQNNNIKIEIDNSTKPQAKEPDESNITSSITSAQISTINNNNNKNSSEEYDNFINNLTITDFYICNENKAMHHDPNFWLLTPLKNAQYHELCKKFPSEETIIYTKYVEKREEIIEKEIKPLSQYQYESMDESQQLFFNNTLEELSRSVVIKPSEFTQENQDNMDATIASISVKPEVGDDKKIIKPSDFIQEDQDNRDATIASISVKPEVGDDKNFNNNTKNKGKKTLDAKRKTKKVCIKIEKEEKIATTVNLTTSLIDGQASEAVTNFFSTKTNIGDLYLDEVINAYNKKHKENSPGKVIQYKNKNLIAIKDTTVEHPVKIINSKTKTVETIGKFNGTEIRLIDVILDQSKQNYFTLYKNEKDAMYITKFNLLNHDHESIEVPSKYSILTTSFLEMEGNNLVVKGKCNNDKIIICFNTQTRKITQPEPTVPLIATNPLGQSMMLFKR